MTLPAAIIAQKNAVSTKAAWLIFLEVTFTNGTVLYLVRNNENVTRGGQEYTATNFTLDTNKQTAQGEIPTVSLSISNVTRVVQAYLETLEGAVGSTVKLMLVNSDNLESDHTDLDLQFDVLATSANAYYATFTLGAPNPMRMRFPQYRYISRHCNWRFKSAECAYTGADLTCKRTLTDCRSKANSARFGGYVGLDSGGVRFV